MNQATSNLRHRAVISIEGLVLRITLHAVRKPLPGHPDRWAVFRLVDPPGDAYRCLVWPDEYARLERWIDLHAELRVTGLWNAADETLVVDEVREVRR